MSIVDLAAIAYARWRLILLCGLVAAMGGTVTAWVLPARYTSTATVLMEIGGIDPETQDTVSGKMLASYIGTQMELAATPLVTGRVVDNLGWADDPETIAAHAATGSRTTVRDWLAQRISASVQVYVVPDSDLLKLAFTTSDPESARNTAELLRTAFIDEVLAQKVNAIQNLSVSLKRESLDLERSYREAVARRTSFVRDKGILLGPDQYNDLDSRNLTTLAKQVDHVGQIAPTSSDALSKAAKLARLDAVIASLESQYGPNHIRLIELKSRRQMLAGQAESSKRVNPPSRPVVEQYYQMRRAKVFASMDDMDHLERLNREIDAARNRYLMLAKFAADKGQASQASSTNFRAIGNASQGIRVFPRWSLAVFGSLAFGLIIGLEVAILSELLNQRVRVRSKLEMLTGTEVLAELATKQRRAWYRSIRALQNLLTRQSRAFN